MLILYLIHIYGDEKAIRHVLYNCSATRTSVESQTKEESIEPVTETLTISATPLPNGRSKARTGDTTDEAAYSLSLIHILTVCGIHHEMCESGEIPYETIKEIINEQEESQ